MDFARILTRNFCQLFELQFDYVCCLQHHIAEPMEELGYFVFGKRHSPDCWLASGCMACCSASRLGLVWWWPAGALGIVILEKLNLVIELLQFGWTYSERESWHTVSGLGRITRAIDSVHKRPYIGVGLGGRLGLVVSWNWFLLVKWFA